MPNRSLDTRIWNLFAAAAVSLGCDPCAYPDAVDPCERPVDDQPLSCEGKCCDDSDCELPEVCSDSQCIPLEPIPECADKTGSSNTEYLPLELEDHPRAMTMVHANQDAKKDLVFVDAGGVGLTFGGEETVTRIPATPTGWLVGIYQGDVDADGDQDLLLPDNAVTGRVEVLLNDGDGGFEVTETLTGPKGTWDVAVGDFDGDGADDIVSTDDGYLFWYRSLRNGEFARVNDVYVGGFGELWVVAGQLWSDPREEILLSRGSDQLGLGWWRPTEPTVATVAGERDRGAVGVALVDLNGDGLDEILQLEPLETETRVIVHDGNRLDASDASRQFRLPFDVYAVRTSDVDGDGFGDLVFQTYGGVGVLHV